MFMLATVPAFLHIVVGKSCEQGCTGTGTLSNICGSPQGDRVGICVTQFDPKQVERCLVCSPGDLPTLTGGRSITLLGPIPRLQSAMW